MKKKVYLVGAMEKVDTDTARRWREVAKAYLSQDFTVISPMDFYSYDKKEHKTENEIFRFEMNLVRNSDVLLVNLDHIRKSIGSCDEIIYAYMHEIPVVGFLHTDYELTDEELMKEIHPWKYLQIDRVETGKDAFNKALDYLIDYYGGF